MNDDGVSRAICPRSNFSSISPFLPPVHKYVHTQMVIERESLTKCISTSSQMDACHFRLASNSILITVYVKISHFISQRWLKFL